MTETKVYGKVKSYFRTRSYGFIELEDQDLKIECKDIFFHLDHIPTSIPLEQLVKGHRFRFNLKKVNRGWAAEDMELCNE